MKRPTPSTRSTSRSTTRSTAVSSSPRSRPRPRDNMAMSPNYDEDRSPRVTLSGPETDPVMESPRPARNPRRFRGGGAVDGGKGYRDGGPCQTSGKGFRGMF